MSDVTAAGDPTHQRAGADWLMMRRPADEGARDASAPLLARLNDHIGARFGARCGDHPGERIDENSVAGVVDVGAGSGANLAWLAPRLTLRQRWTLIDRDEELLALAPAAEDVTNVVGVHPMAADIEEVRAAAGGAPDLITGSAVLDVLTRESLQALCESITGAGAAALFSLTVTGTVTLDPRHGDDDRIGSAFNAHQRRAALAGPEAVALAGRQLRSAGYEVHVCATPWQLGAAEVAGGTALAARYLRERAEAAVDHEPRLEDTAGRWLGDRLGRLADGRLSVVVEHQDLLALPPV